MVLLERHQLELEACYARGRLELERTVATLSQPLVAAWWSAQDRTSRNEKTLREDDHNGRLADLPPEMARADGVRRPKHASEVDVALEQLERRVRADHYRWWRAYRDQLVEDPHLQHGEVYARLAAREGVPVATLKSAVHRVEKGFVGVLERIVSGRSLVGPPDTVVPAALERARSLHVAERFVEMEAELSRIAHFDPEITRHPVFLNLLAIARLRVQEDASAAMELLERGLQVADDLPTRARLLNTCGVVANALGQAVAKERYFRRALACDPSMFVAHLSLLCIACERQDHALALARLEAVGRELCKPGPAEPRIHALRALVGDEARGASPDPDLAWIRRQKYWPARARRWRPMLDHLSGTLESEAAK